METTRLRQLASIVGLAAAIAGLSASLHARAADTRTSEALKMITDTAAQICESVPVAQSASGATLSGDAQAKLGGLVGRIANLGLSGTGQYHTEQSAGVLQKDLAIAIKDANNCKLQVFQTLARDLIGSNRLNNEDEPGVLGPAVAIVSVASGKCLSIPVSKSDHTLIEQDTCQLGVTQRWILPDSGYGEIVNQYSGKCIDIPWGSVAEQTMLQLYTCQGAGNQLWLHNTLGEFVSSRTGKCIDVPWVSTADHVVVQQAGCHGGDNQRWMIRKQDG